MTAPTAPYVRGTHADHRATINQITRGVLASCGARQFVHDDKNGLLMFSVGRATARRLHKVVIHLMPSDTYRVERGHLDRKTFEWVTEEVEEDVFCDALARTVLRLGDR